MRHGFITPGIIQAITSNGPSCTICAIPLDDNWIITFTGSQLTYTMFWKDDLTCLGLYQHYDSLTFHTHFVQ
ncbi:uncharacterized protein BJ212DRAFT_1333175 [Suillus subaureus]|uniref:Uncharacterized protein n=1 Tax=Suillus subaureus TaxID=48587 RepID=A0A9P7EHQ1_9AGAM|nr:uncharacterized protein BJ212DRAFT_1333175 [Suillus subaureus]KAG1821746.1 hypothetical protein BJ212DRAFT_1333175 [Suillus subaureus]